MTPKRVQRSRAKGSKLPADTVCVTRPGKWGNPFVIGECYRLFGSDTSDHSRWRRYNQTIPWPLPGHTLIETAEQAVAVFRRYAIIFAKRYPKWLAPLQGKHLACWCAVDAPYCHADVLLELANRE